MKTLAEIAERFEFDPESVSLSELKYAANTFQKELDFRKSEISCKEPMK